tara:strand:- start:7446 stop:9032 length:1587 start_codon:yes stop_codon:yes gene_type:complete
LYFKPLLKFIFIQLFIIFFFESLFQLVNISKYFKPVISDLDDISATKYAEKDPIYGYRLKKNSFIEEYQINSLGFRSNDFDRKKNPNIIRIFIVGGSATFGSNSGGNNLTYSGILQDLLNKISDVNIEVINSGVLGYSTWQTKLKVNEIINYDPDLIIFMDGFVDAVRANDLKLEEINTFVRDNNKELYSLSKDQNKFLKYLLENSLLVSAVKEFANLYSVDKKKESENILINRIDQQDSLSLKIKEFKTKDNIEEYISNIKKSDIKILILKKPWIIDSELIYNKYYKEVLAHDFIRNIDKDFYINSYQIINEILIDVVNSNSLPFIDLHQTYLEYQFEYPQMFFSDHYHFNRYGNYLIAKKIASFLFENQYLLSDENILKSDPELIKIESLNYWVPNINTIFLDNNPLSISFEEQLPKTYLHHNEIKDWGYISSNTDQLSLEINLNEPIKKFVFYPRVFDKNSFVKIKHNNDLLFEINGKYNKNSGIANFYNVNLNNNIKKISIDMKNAQLWYRDHYENIFFKIKDD